VHQYFNRLKERVSLLGNHHQKYIHTIELHMDRMVESLERAGKIEEIHLWRGSTHPRQEMEIVLKVARSFDEQLTYLACYYSLQILHLNLRSIDVLMLNLTAAEDHISIYKQFMLNTGAEFRILTAAYMQTLLDLFSNSAPLPTFTMLGVGSLAHQDDIDVGVIDDGSQNREALNLVIGRVRKEMFKWATELHFYLSEHVGSQFYTASIDEYKNLLDEKIQDFVIISEMLSAVPILGSTALFETFEQEITHRYHYHSNRDNKYHEGYLRGILGEIRSFLFRQINEDKLNPKDDALRMISGIIFSGKTIFRIYRGNRWDVLAQLARKDVSRRHLYQNLEKSLTFMEIFRHLFQLYVGLEEEVDLADENVPEYMSLVARTLGYRDVGAISAWDHLLIHYHEYVELARNTCSRLLGDVTEHIKSISIFADKIKSAWYPEPYRSYPGNLAIDFLKISAFFRGAKFWDDILESLEAEDSHVLENFINDFKLLKPRYQHILFEKYGQMVQYAILPMISFLIILSKNKRKLDIENLFDCFNQEFLKNLWLCDNRIVRVTNVFYQDPQLLNTYLSTLEVPQQRQFAEVLVGDLWEAEQERPRELLLNLCELHSNTSHYFKRFFTRVVSRYPEYIKYLKDTASLARFSQGFFGSIQSLDSFEDKKNQLGDYHDLEFFRVGLDALHGKPIEQIDTEFTEFSDSYMQLLFDICKQSVNEQIGGPIATRDLIAIYTAGGYAREQAFDDDYDLIIMLNEKDEEVRQYCNRIITMMNSEIVKRGIMPHYRFADHFGHYVTLIDDLDEFFEHEDETTFIDKSQMLGARMIVGSTIFQKKFEERIIHRHVYEKCDHYIGQMIAEMQSRHEDKRNTGKKNLNVKEGIGGLRDIEILLLIYKAKLRLTDPLNRKLLQTICKLDKSNEQDLCQLMRHFDFLKRLRDLYRLTVSAGNILKTEYLGQAAKIFGYTDEKGKSAIDQLVEEYLTCTEQVHGIVQRMIDKVYQRSNVSTHA